MSEWMDIETAPKDGTRIRVRGGAKLWTEQDYPEWEKTLDEYIAQWDETETYYGQKGEWWVGYAECYDEHILIRPLQWQPTEPLSPEDTAE